MSSPVYNQEDWAFGADDGGINANTFDTVNTNRTAQAPDSTFRLRFVVQQTNSNKSVSNAIHALYASYNGGAYFAVTTTSTYVQLTNDANGIADHATTTQVIGDGTYGTGDAQGWNDGQTDDNTGAIDYNGAEEVEVEFCLTIPSGDVADTDTLDFEVRQSDGTQLDSYNSRPQATVSESSAATQTVNAADGSLTTTGEVAAVSPGAATISAQTGDLTAAGEVGGATAESTAGSITYVANRGEAESTDTGTTVTVTATANVAVGALLIVRVGSRPYGATGSTTDISVSDSQGNTYTRLVEYTNADGAMVGLFYSILDTALTGSTDTVTATLAGDTIARVIALEEFSLSGTLVVEDTNANSGGGTSPSVSLSGLAEHDYLFLGELAVGDTLTSQSGVTHDADFTDYDISEVDSTYGTRSVDVFIVGGYRQTTAATSETYNLTIDWRYYAIAIVALRATGGTSQTSVSASVGELTTTGEVATVSPGAATIAANAAELTSSGESATVAPGTATISAADRTLVSSGQVATVLPGSVAITGQVGELTASGPTGNVSSVAGIAAGVGDMFLYPHNYPATVLPGAVTLESSTVDLASSGESATVTPGSATINAQVADLTASGDVASVSGVGAVIAQVRDLTAAGLSATVQPGAVTLLAQVGELTAAGETGNAISATAVSAQVGALTAAGQPATVAPGAIAISAGLADLVSTGESGGITIDYTLSAGLADLTATGEVGGVLSGAARINAGVGELTAAAGMAGTVIPGATTIGGSVGELVAEGPTATVSLVVTILAATGELTAAAGMAGTVIPGPVTISAQTGELVLQVLVADLLMPDHFTMDCSDAARYGMAVSDALRYAVVVTDALDINLEVSDS